MPNLNLNGRFRELVQDMVKELIKDPNQVRLVMRWNENDNLLWEYRSLAKDQTRVPGGGSAHAEEIMIVDWPIFIAANNNQQPLIIEIFLSMSPCIDRSPKRTILGTNFQAGCANKLASIISHIPDADWRICFFNYYQEGDRIEPQVYTAPAILNAASGNVDAHLFKDRRYTL